MAKKESSAVAEVTTNFDLVTGYEGMDEDTRAELEDEMDDFDDGGTIARMIRIPAGGGKNFQVETEDPDDPEELKEIQGVILFTHKMNAWWRTAFGTGSGNEPPTCASMDGKQGVMYETGVIQNCDTCPMNQFKDDGSGKACKNMRRIYILMSGRPVPYLLNVPPTSMKGITQTLRRIMGGNKVPYTSMIVSFRLQQATSRANIKYSQVTVQKVGELSPEQAKAVREIRTQLKSQYQNVGISRDDYEQDEGAAVRAAGSAPADENGFINVPDSADDAGLPFNECV